MSVSRNKVTALEMAQLCEAVSPVPEMYAIARALCAEVDALRAAAEPEARHRDARAHAQDMASFAFNTAMQMLRPPVDGDHSPWLDKITDEFETQILAMRAAVEPEAKDDELSPEQRQAFNGGGIPGNETCLYCGKHISRHFGGTEYRCYARNV